MEHVGDIKGAKVTGPQLHSLVSLYKHSSAKWHHEEWSQWVDDAVTAPTGDDGVFTVCWAGEYDVLVYPDGSTIVERPAEGAA